MAAISKMDTNLCWLDVRDYRSNVSIRNLSKLDSSMVTQDLDSSFFIYLDRSIAITIVKIFNVRVFKHSIEIHQLRMFVRYFYKNPHFPFQFLFQKIVFWDTIPKSEFCRYLYINRARARISWQRWVVGSKDNARFERTYKSVWKRWKTRW